MRTNIKKIISFALALAAAALLAPAFAMPARAETTAARNRYEVSLSVSGTGKTLRVWGKMRVTYHNDSSDTLYTIVLRLHANDVSKNCMSIDMVAAGGKSAVYTLNSQGSILTVSLPMEIAPGESTDIFLRFDMTLPETGDRFGKNSTGFMLGNALPIVAMYENGAWRTDEYYSYGDSFFSRVSDYTVGMKVPSDYTLACSGTVAANEYMGGGYTRYYIKAESAREFAFAVMSTQKTASAAARNGRVTVYAAAETASEAQFAAKCGAAAIDYFSEKIGEYPYSSLWIVPFDLSGGMEYPGLIMIDKNDFKGANQNSGALVIGHEAAHQWFYGAVGSDQINSPWLDESLVEYLGCDFLRQYIGESQTEALESERYAYIRNGYTRTKRLDASLSELKEDYFYIVYGYGHEFYAALVDKIGSGAFYEGLKTYFNANYMGIGTKEKLISAFSEAADTDLTDWFEANIAVRGGQ